MSEMILITIREYEERKELLELERKEMSTEIKKIEKAQNTINKLNIEGLEISVPYCKDDIEYYNNLTRDIKVCISVLRRLETVFKAYELIEEINIINE